MKTSFKRWHILQRACFTGGHVLKEATLIACLFNMFCRCKHWSFLVSESCPSLVDMFCKLDWCLSSVSFWWLSDCVVVITCRCVWCSSSV